MRKKEKEGIIFEESLTDWSHDLDLVEVRLSAGPLVYLGAAIVLIALAVSVRIFLINYGGASNYTRRAAMNMGQYARTPAPRGIIYDKNGEALAQNKAVFTALLDVKEFLHRKDLEEKTLEAVNNLFEFPAEDIWSRISAGNLEKSADPVVLSPELSQNELVAVKALNLPTITVVNSFKRSYPGGPAFASLLGYVGLPTVSDIKNDSTLSTEDLVGKAGVEAFYDKDLRGAPGTTLTLKNAQGEQLGDAVKSEPQPGKPLSLNIDAEFQKYFYRRMAQGLASLGRTSGVGLAINPRNGEVLSIINFPVFDNNVFSAPENSDEIRKILDSSLKPLFDRAVAGSYSPGSTIKPLVAVAALKEGVIDAQSTIFSPGYLDIPNPYDPTKSTRYLDWRYQGDVNVYSAIAQSSDVYFYEVGSGWDAIKGLGITKLNEWWRKFGLGSPTGIDLPGEGKGFLPTPDWKEKTMKHPWLLGDSFNVSIGQGDLLVTPIQLLSYIGAIANGGKIYQPEVRKGSMPAARADLSDLLPQIKEVQKGMRLAVESLMGTAYVLHDLPFSVGAKTGSAQVENNMQENAFFVGYAPFDNPQIAILVLIENSKEGSLNAVPIAKDVLNWYYNNRIKNGK